MPTVDEALTQAKIILAAINPAPYDGPVAVYRRPDDEASVTMKRLPVVLVSELVGVENRLSRATLGGQGYHDWTLEVLVFLAPGPIESDRQAAAVEPLHRAWNVAMTRLFLNRDSGATTLNHTALRLGRGTEEPLLTYRAGHLHWYQTVCWGVRYLLPVRQTVHFNE